MKFQTSIVISFLGDRQTKVCGSLSIDCYRDAEKRLFGEDIIDGLKDEAAKMFRERCNCLPACKTITYDVAIDRAKIDFEAIIHSNNLNREKYAG